MALPNVTLRRPQCVWKSLGYLPGRGASRVGVCAPFSGVQISTPRISFARFEARLSNLFRKSNAPPTLSGSTPVTGPGSVIRTEVSNQQIPLYFVGGAEALKAERNALQKNVVHTNLQSQVCCG